MTIWNNQSNISTLWNNISNNSSIYSIVGAINTTWIGLSTFYVLSELNDRFITENNTPIRTDSNG
jgi:hypothetical protein